MNAAGDPGLRNGYGLRGPYRNHGGFLWEVNLPQEFDDDGDDVGYPDCSAWALLENGSPIGPMHAEVADIQSKGAGRARHWKSRLLFATSDNSDPNLNGRNYRLVWTGGGDKKWLARLASESVAEPIPFGPRADVVRCSGVLAVIGWSYSGSTVVTAFAGAHPSIFGGGELHWLLRRPMGRDSQCAICGRDCPHWTLDARAGVSIETLYDDTSRIFGRPFIVDSSKNPPWFGKLLPIYPDLPTVRILLVKHPVRQVSSEFEKKSGAVSFADCAKLLRDLRLFYEEVALRGERPFEAKYYRGPRLAADFLVRYEDFARDPAAALTPALARFGLEYHPRMAAWQTAEHHHIGGNVGPTVQINNSRVRSAVATKKYRARGIFLDNSYSDVLDLDMISMIMRNPDGQWLCERFGYEL